MRMTTGTAIWPPDMCGMVAALFMIWSSAKRLKLQVMISTIGLMPTIARADAGADEGGLGKRRVFDAAGAEFLQQALGNRGNSRHRGRHPHPSGRCGGSSISAWRIAWRQASR